MHETHVLCERTTACKRLLTNSALMRPFARVAEKMINQCGSSCEPSRAEMAFTGPFASVSAQVNTQSIVSVESLRAQMALKWSLACMNSDVLLQARWRSILVVTEVTAVAASVLWLRSIRSCWRGKRLPSKQDLAACCLLKRHLDKRNL